MVCRLLYLLAAIPLALAIASPALAQGPRVTSFTPDRGPPGTLVKIIGERLDTVVGVQFGGVEAASVRIISNLHIKAVVPQGATTGPIGLVSGDGLRTYTLRSFVVAGPLPTPPSLFLATPVPSPTAGTTRLPFGLPSAGPARLAIFDATGRQIRLLAEGDLGAGPHERFWDGLDDRGQRVASGIFFVRLEVPSARVARPLVVIR